MRFTQLTRSTAVSLAVVGLLLPHSAVAAPPGPPTDSGRYPPIRDVALDVQGQLHGRVVNASGHGEPATLVRLVRAGQEVTTVTSAHDGSFVVPGVRGGTYQLVAQEAVSPYRLWAPNTAPPGAEPVAVVPSGPPTPTTTSARVRPVMQILRNPWVWGGAVAAAVAIPLALDDHNDQPTD